MSRLRVAGKIILQVTLVLSLAVTTLVTIESIGRQTLSAEPQLRYLRGATSQEELFVLVPGAQVTDKIFAQHVKFFQKKGAVLVINFAPDRFEINVIVRRLVGAIPSTHTKITFVGDSMGGLVSYDTAVVMRQRGDQRPIRLLLIDSPTGTGDLFMGLAARVFAHVPFGPLSNKWLTKPVWKILFTPSDINKIEARDVEELEAMWYDMTTFHLSAYVDQLAYMSRHLRLRPISNCRGAFVQSTRDEVVKPSAAQGWPVVCSDRFVVIPVNSTHGSLLDFPDRYDQAFEEAYEHLNAA